MRDTTTLMVFYCDFNSNKLESRTIISARASEHYTIESVINGGLLLELFIIMLRRCR